MKYIIILGDGMADEPIESLGNKTPLQVADIPAMDELSRLGRSGRLHTIPDGFQPGSEIANLSVLGYNVAEVFEGRGSLEAASMGVQILPGEMAMRCNLIAMANDRIKNHSAGHISSVEAEELIHFLNKHLANEKIRFYPGVSYRHLLKMKEGNKKIACTPPHDAQGMLWGDVMVRPLQPEAQETAGTLNRLIIESQRLLNDHPVNRKRIAAGKDPANSVWFWSPGYKPQMQPMPELFPIRSGVVISAVDLINGIGIYAGLHPVRVEGATGLYDTNYEGKARAALDALKDHDFVYLHVEASDEAGHEGDVDLKIRTIEYLDHRIVRPILQEIRHWKEPVSIALLPDHPTPCRIKTHTGDPVPFVIYKPGQTPDEVSCYDEVTAQRGGYGLLQGKEFMDALFH